MKKLVIIALASDDELMEQLVLKGGNAIEFMQSAQGKLSRFSNDIDFSMQGSFDEDLEEVKPRLQRTIVDTFSENGLVVFDYLFTVRPSEVSDDVKHIWGGYNVSFKLTTPADVARAKGDLEQLRRSAMPIQSNNSPKIEIDISKFEFVRNKQTFEIGGFTIYIYSPEMIVFEKLRAICQQLPGYTNIIPGYRARPRARDFYDIPMLVDQFHIQPATGENKQLIEAIFSAKRVPLQYIQEIKNNLNLHRGDWPNLLATLPATERDEVNNFDQYAGYIIDLFELLTFP